MSDHRLSDDGQRVECHADIDANCRRRPGPECEHENWPCGHEILSGQSCWMIEWTNASMLDDTYSGPGAPITTYPGRDVLLDWDGDNVTWDYDRSAARESVPA